MKIIQTFYFKKSDVQGMRIFLNFQFSNLAYCSKTFCILLLVNVGITLLKNKSFVPNEMLQQNSPNFGKFLKVQKNSSSFFLFLFLVTCNYTLYILNVLFSFNIDRGIQQVKNERKLEMKKNCRSFPTHKVQLILKHFARTFN